MSIVAQNPILLNGEDENFANCRKLNIFYTFLHEIYSFLSYFDEEKNCIHWNLFTFFLLILPPTPVLSKTWLLIRSYVLLGRNNNNHHGTHHHNTISQRPLFRSKLPLGQNIYISFSFFDRQENRLQFTQ